MALKWCGEGKWGVGWVFASRTHCAYNRLDGLSGAFAGEKWLGDSAGSSRSPILQCVHTEGKLPCSVLPWRVRLSQAVYTWPTQQRRRFFKAFRVCRWGKHKRGWKNDGNEKNEELSPDRIMIDGAETGSTSIHSPSLIHPTVRHTTQIVHGGPVEIQRRMGLAAASHRGIEQHDCTLWGAAGSPCFVTAARTHFIATVYSQYPSATLMRGPQICNWYFIIRLW